MTLGTKLVLLLEIQILEAVDDAHLARLQRLAGQFGGVMSTLTGFTDSERAAMTKMLYAVYDQFTQKAAKGRGMKHADLEKLARGRVYTGSMALKIGLVDEVVGDADGLDAALTRWRELIAHGAPRAITRIKRAMAHDDEINQFGCCFSCDDAHEGMKAFLDKRPPNWKT